MYMYMTIKSKTGTEFSSFSFHEIPYNFDSLEIVILLSDLQMETVFQGNLSDQCFTSALGN